ncbi:translation initiation factor IF-2 [Candidatus Giovannonibacteria bacterium RIFCSPHIGHO2_02_43_13]|uniref:Translation initiation factor IF-2 n=1 Tax=Candidatus Giovannonibacteria bacterium RIFCSPHIGHO2_02_43_13 TaxID=1798330 RepID=A0A1F5WU84_9BACT|nr:MAG: Translation initiation factor IF-2 [Parcubacteria group bacterium GW2011_GWA2_44_13]OGF72110.1 MAG: translation initiation factor IF-2 [Candidatus Giovannonibacteria bacterium RIFCSPHIGHO2_12_FULL_44_42]OGF79217.1 MAG: translation initiation factor IF-2 [Candidatus Giovannonibacteria bacterium RIFCSPHIGHO2_02_43_13]OGF89987.1 MAG: translation initiation factor IF-2 [Candidatus Giovannonibacteria bacterium RIFCSPLOWO2_02_FULL_43_54]OGF97104.1 MAG: translation initiation factor IF-2 [Cand
MEEINKNLISRPPIIVVMGHIDHGKTTLLDRIRKSNVAAGEAGGITQHIGAYEVLHHSASSGQIQKITFLDTPGHEAFTKMRSRGAKIADIAILVVAADDGVKPQTKEALAIIKENKMLFLIVVNKIDKAGVDIEKVKSEFTKEEVYLEGRGGSVPACEISAKTGTGVSELLETILLMAELEDFKGDPTRFAEGVIIESHLDKKRGNTSTLLIREGTLKKGEYVVAGGSLTKVRILENFLGEGIDSAGLSTPAVVVGFDELPQVGTEFRAFFSQKEAAEEVRKFKEASRSSASSVGGPQTQGVFQRDVEEWTKVVLGIVIKSDVQGSGEAIRHEIEKVKSEKIEIKYLRTEAGDVSLDDVKLASSAKNTMIVAFKAGVSQDARDLAERIGVPIASFQIIYEIAQFVKEKMLAILPVEMQKTILGKAKILKIFKGEKNSQVVGGKVIEGAIKKNTKYNILRRENKIGGGKIDNLQSGRTNVGEVEAPNEFGAMCESTLALVLGDVIESYLEEEVKGKL